MAQQNFKKEISNQREASRNLVKVSEIENALKESPENKKITEIKTTQETLRPTQTRRKIPSMVANYVMGFLPCDLGSVSQQSLTVFKRQTLPSHTNLQNKITTLEERIEEVTPCIQRLMYSSLSTFDSLLISVGTNLQKEIKSILQQGSYEIKLYM
jgi:hypothetical protein